MKESLRSNALPFFKNPMPLSKESLKIVSIQEVMLNIMRQI